MLPDTTLRQAFPGLQTPLPSSRGKVRDAYVVAGQRLLVATDRISAFDRVVGAVAGRGQILNRLAAWWLEKASAVCPTHFLALEDAHCMRVKNAQVLGVEVIVRGYISGSTKTSLWTLYEAGQREIYGVRLPDGLQKNDRLPTPLITPTSKATKGGHDVPMSAGEIVGGGLVPRRLWEQIEEVSLALFALGQRCAQQAGLVLVDTKYEFGLIEGKLALVDEVHTPDSSRYWDAASLANSPHAPVSMDKEQLRLWLAAQGYRGEGEPPMLDAQIQQQIVQRYTHVYQALTGQPMVFAMHAAAQVQQSVGRFLAQMHTTEGG